MRRRSVGALETVYPAPSVVACSVDTMKFRGGRTWERGGRPVAMSGSAATGSGGETSAAAHPATCQVMLADGRQIAILWENEGCANARRAYLARTPPARARSPWPFTCTVVESTEPNDYAWSDDACAPARAQYASEPDWMHVRLRYSHDSAPENLVDGHPKFCDPYRSGILKDVHPVWSSAACRNARIKWDVIHGDAPPPAK